MSLTNMFDGTAKETSHKNLVCFGTLTMGPLQRNLSISEGATLMELAYHKGIRFFDTAELYETYPYIKAFLKRPGIRREEVIIASKSYAYDEASAKASLNKALEEMELTYIDIFLLHEQESIHTLRGHEEALVYYQKKKEEGVIRHLGLSTHHIAAVKAGCNHPLIEVIHPIFNKHGVGIQDGSIEDMIQACEEAKSKGKYIFTMKPLGGGHLISSYEEALDFVLSQPCVDAIAIGMQSKKEVEMNAAYLVDRRPLTKEELNYTLEKERSLMIHDWCTVCGACVARCDHKALEIGKEGIVIHQDRCVLCGYCSTVCPEFCIKVI